MAKHGEAPDVEMTCVVSSGQEIFQGSAKKVFATQKLRFRFANRRPRRSVVLTRLLLDARWEVG